MDFTVSISTCIFIHAQFLLLSYQERGSSSGRAIGRCDKSWDSSFPMSHLKDGAKCACRDATSSIALRHTHIYDSTDLTRENHSCR